MKQKTMLLGWHFHCDDPTVLLSEEALEKWHGTEGQSDSFEGTHYGLVCEILEKNSDGGGFVHFDNFIGYVPAKRNPLAFIQINGPSELVVLETFDWDEEILCASALQNWKQVPLENWKLLGDFVVGIQGTVMAFHAAADGQDWNHSLEVGISINLTPGHYEIMYALLDSGASLIYWRWKQGDV